MNLSDVATEYETTIKESPLNQIESPPHFLDVRNGEALDACGPHRRFERACYKGQSSRMQTNNNEGDTGRINMPNPIIKTKKADKEDEQNDSQAPVD